MGVGVEAPGRDHHSMSSQNQQGQNMTNGFNSDNHGRSNGGDQHKVTKSSLAKNPESASSASTHSPAEPEEKSLDTNMANHNDHTKENGLPNSEPKTNCVKSNSSSTNLHVPNSVVTKVEDCNSSRESIDVESTQPEDIKQFTNINTSTTASTDSKAKSVTQSLPETFVQKPIIKYEEPPPVDWSLYHLGDMTLEVWLQTIRKHVLMSLMRHPKSELFRRPVDPVALGIFPFYNQIITHPMDLGTVKSKFEKELYADKSSCLQDINQVWLNAKKFNPCTHVVHHSADFLQKQMFSMLQNLVKSGGATGRKSLPTALPVPPMRPVGVREAKKRPVGLPGEYDDIKPQHLEQKYATRLTESLKQCDTILRNLMLQSQHWDYVEPFMKPVNNSKGKPTKMSLALINDRLRNYHYTNSIEFATDMRRIVTETYRSATEPIEDDFKAQKAKLLQKEFEWQFAKVKDDEPSETGGMNKASIMKDPYISKLIKAQGLLDSINNGVSSLTNEVVAFMDKKRERRTVKNVQRQKSIATNNHRAIDHNNTHSPPKKRQRTSQSHKKASPVVKPVNIAPQPSVSPTQLGEWIQNLDAEGQEHLLDMLKRNNEEIEVDEEGEVELSLENWSNTTLADVEMYLRLKLSPSIGPTHGISRSTVQNQATSHPANENPQTNIPEYHLPSQSPNLNIPNKTSELDRKSTGGKHISKDDSPKTKLAPDKDGSGSSSDSSESSDDSSSSSSDEN